jgi:hypothetical protein
LIVVPKNQVNYAQLEEAPTPSSYILTTTSSATRAGETLTIPAANLPWPEPVVIGEELVTNGTFDTDTSGWVAFNYQGHTTTISSISGELVVENDPVNGGSGAAYQEITTVVGKTYVVSVDFVSTTAGSPSVLIRNAIGLPSIASITTSGAGTYTVTFTATATTTLIILNFNLTSAGQTMVWDNISVKEINPLAVSIAMEGTMTYADNNQTTELKFVNWLADFSNYIRLSLSTGGVLPATTGTVDFVQRANAVTDRTLSVANSYSPGTNVPFSISSRHGSTFINGAVDGTALTANTTPVALPDLSTTDLDLGSDFMGTIKTFRVWADDISDVGIEEASS